MCALICVSKTQPSQAKPPKPDHDHNISQHFKSKNAKPCNRRNPVTAQVVRRWPARQVSQVSPHRKWRMPWPWRSTLWDRKAFLTYWCLMDSNCIPTRNDSWSWSRTLPGMFKASQGPYYTPLQQRQMPTLWRRWHRMPMSSGINVCCFWPSHKDRTLDLQGRDRVHCLFSGRAKFIRLAPLHTSTLTMCQARALCAPQRAPIRRRSGEPRVTSMLNQTLLDTHHATMPPCQTARPLAFGVAEKRLRPCARWVISGPSEFKSLHSYLVRIKSPGAVSRAETFEYNCSMNMPTGRGDKTCQRRGLLK